MYKELRKKMDEVIDLTDAEFEYFLTFVQPVKFKKKELILKEGETCRYGYFINKGSIRYYYNIDGEQHTGQFFFEGSWYTDYDSFISGTPSRLNIEAMEQTEILRLPKSDMENLYRTIPKLERFSRLMAEKAFTGLRQKTEMLSNQSAEESYLNLIKNRPKVIERIPQHYIASYLGIKPQSLSRIRKNISLKG